MANALEEYEEALRRLVKNKPIRVPKGTRITNDSVALEAGRTKGSIKKSRSNFLVLIQDIRDASLEQEKLADDLKNKLDQARKETILYRELYEAGLGREISLIYEIYEVKKELSRLKSPKLKVV